MSENTHLGCGNIGGDENSTNKKSVNEIQYSESKSLKLSFLNPVRDLVYTGVPIGGGASPDIALIDIHTGNVVKSGSEASAKVGFCVLKESFNKGDRDAWTSKESKEFQESILPGRHGKASLLGKRTHIYLKEGLGSLKDISFSHTRFPLRKTNVRLVARAVDSCGRLRIKEAISDPFVVKDRRGRNKKDYPISLNDKVWRLKNIGRYGPSHKILCKEKIDTVNDFLVTCRADPGKLHNILRETMSSEKLEATINHAKKCEDNMEKHLPFSISQQNAGVALENVEEDGLEAEHAAMKMVSDKDDTSDRFVAAAFKNSGEGSVDHHSSNPFLVANSDGIKDLDRLDPFLEEEHQWHLHDTSYIIRAENEHRQSDHFNRFQSTVFSPAADPHRFLGCDVFHGRFHIRWKLLRSILRWLTIRRIVARRLEALQSCQQDELFRGNDLNATNASTASVQVG